MRITQRDVTLFATSALYGLALWAVGIRGLGEYAFMVVVWIVLGWWNDWSILRHERRRRMNLRRQIGDADLRRGSRLFDQEAG